MATTEVSTLPPSANVIKLSDRDLLDYRAVQRTFDGAYARTALGQLCYATVILRLFQPKFFYIGLVYAVLGMLFIPVAIFRYRMAVNNAHRLLAMQEVQPQETSNSIPDPSPSNAEAASEAQRSSQRRNTASSASPEPTQPVRTVLRESFVTAGSVVAAATALVGLAEIALLVLILRV
ncbi:hypothetical protein PHSY_002101 [Pseudozyma hubeiensis SY62]|uniref:DUF202 domain-containing protein n=1 Tax=Pseudozyma hubeiensis (strain SY62) TaxID=1305764 RepID=R9P0B7_PSEHS|nr:hypothetical protein PHSY_002101 [Pseudozyma hubeiensis SY62]GAC94529.1 hypothetical protein PHSY_002101 [Pseudozyma hubeiensis SY62]